MTDVLTGTRFSIVTCAKATLPAFPLEVRRQVADMGFPVPPLFAATDAIVAPPSQGNAPASASTAQDDLSQPTPEKQHAPHKRLRGVSLRQVQPRGPPVQAWWEGGVKRAGVF